MCLVMFPWRYLLIYIYSTDIEAVHIPILLYIGLGLHACMYRWIDIMSMVCTAIYLLLFCYSCSLSTSQLM